MRRWNCSNARILELLDLLITSDTAAAHLAGVVAAHTVVPVIGVPIDSSPLGGFDALLSTVQMPPGVPVATVSIGGARNAGLLAVRILGASDPALQERMISFQAGLEQMVLEKDEALRKKLLGD